TAQTLPTTIQIPASLSLQKFGSLCACPVLFSNPTSYSNFISVWTLSYGTTSAKERSAEYETECQKLIAHFKTLSSTLKDIVPSIERFHNTYKKDCPAALNWLVTSGVPPTVEHRAAAAMSATTSPAIVAECVLNFITAMDSLKLNMVAVDQVHPVLSDLSQLIRSIQCCRIYQLHSIS
ncbi:vacuolar sorting-associated 28 homolog 2, partial [Olea europaea subsp. europaea]